MHSPCSAQTGSCMGVIGRYHSSEVDTEKSGVKLRRPPHNWDRKRARGFLEAPRSRHIALHCRAKMPARSASKQLGRFNAAARRIVGFGCPNMVYELATTSPIDLFKSPKCLGDFAFAIDWDKYLFGRPKRIKLPRSGCFVFGFAATKHFNRE